MHIFGHKMSILFRAMLTDKSTGQGFHRPPRVHLHCKPPSITRVYDPPAFSENISPSSATLRCHCHKGSNFWQACGAQPTQTLQRVRYYSLLSRHLYWKMKTKMSHHWIVTAFAARRFLFTHNPISCSTTDIRVHLIHSTTSYKIKSTI